MLKTPSRRGMIVILSSPSGAGKSTLARMLIDHDPSLTLSVSVTTRPPRRGEVDGVDYHFISEESYRNQTEHGELLEYAQVFDHHYGTPRASVMETLKAGKDILFDIDWQGTQQIFAALPEDVVRIFILPPSRAILQKRLRTRAQDAEDVIQRRMAKADQEISHFNEYDYVIVNDTLSESFAKIQRIIATEREKLSRQPAHKALAESLLSHDFQRS